MQMELRSSDRAIPADPAGWIDPPFRAAGRTWLVRRLYESTLHL